MKRAPIGVVDMIDAGNTITVACERVIHEVICSTSEN